MPPSTRNIFGRRPVKYCESREGVRTHTHIPVIIRVDRMKVVHSNLRHLCNTAPKKLVDAIVIYLLAYIISVLSGWHECKRYVPEMETLPALISLAIPRYKKKINTVNK